MISSIKFYVSVVLITLTFVSMGMAVPIPEEEACSILEVCQDTFERDRIPSDARVLSKVACGMNNIAAGAYSNTSIGY